MSKNVRNWNVQSTTASRSPINSNSRSPETRPIRIGPQKTTGVDLLIVAVLIVALFAFEGKKLL